MSLFQYEWVLASRRWTYFINPIAFFMIICCVFAMALDAAPQVLPHLAPSITWMAILLSFIMSLPALFEEDYKDGSLAQWLVSGRSVSARVLMRLSLHWLFLVTPIVLLTPFVGLMYHLDSATVLRLCLSIVLATPLVMLVGALMSAILLSARQANVLLAILLLPLLVPILLLSVGICVTPNVVAIVLVLLALLVMALSTLPVLISSALWASMA